MEPDETTHFLCLFNRYEFAKHDAITNGKKFSLFKHIKQEVALSKQLVKHKPKGKT